MFCLFLIKSFACQLISPGTADRHPHNVIIEIIIRPFFSVAFYKAAVHLRHQILIFFFPGFLIGIHHNLKHFCPGPEKFTDNLTSVVILIDYIKSIQKILHCFFCLFYTHVCFLTSFRLFSKYWHCCHSCAAHRDHCRCCRTQDSFSYFSRKDPHPRSPLPFHPGVRFSVQKA